MFGRFVMFSDKGVLGSRTASVNKTTLNRLMLSPRGRLKIYAYPISLCCSVERVDNIAPFPGIVQNVFDVNIVTGYRAFFT